MPLLKYRNLENPTQQARLYRVEIGSPTVSGRLKFLSPSPLARKPQELHAQPMPFRLGKHFEVAILARVYQGHHSHTAQCRPGGGEALRLERLEERGEAKVRQELALEGVAHSGETVPVTQPHEG